MKEKILLDSALQSWKTSIRYCNKLKEGIATLENKKMFVITLQNAVELFLKQLMIDKNDHRVVSFTNMDMDGEPIKSYLQSTALNEYFEKRNKQDKTKIKSIEFSQMKDIVKQYLSANNQPSISRQLTLLKELRNDATHFHIKYNDFLTDSEFVELYDFMVIFADILEFYCYIPKYPDDELSFTDQLVRIDKINKPTKGFKYKKVFSMMEEYKRIKDFFNDMGGRMIHGIFRYNLELEMAYIYCSEEKNNHISADIELDRVNRVYEIINAMKAYDLVKIVEKKTEDGIKFIVPIIR